MENCCDSMVKYLIFIFNFFLFLSGVALLASGIYAEVEMSTYWYFVESSYVNSQTLIISIGAILVIIGFFGCCGACTESHKMMYVFASLLTLVVLAEVRDAFLKLVTPLEVPYKVVARYI